LLGRSDSPKASVPNYNFLVEKTNCSLRVSSDSRQNAANQNKLFKILTNEIITYEAVFVNLYKRYLVV
jgi:hypothetical protein